ncbi:hypothetical protein VTO73DRAFT_10813 [Trametes versicolor]
MGTDQLTDSLTVTILRTTDDDGAAMALDSLSTVELRVYRVHEDGRPSSFVTARQVGRGTLKGARCMLTDESLVALLRAGGIIPLPAFEQGRAVERPPLLRGTSRPESAGTGASQLTASSGIIELADDKGYVSPPAMPYRRAPSLRGEDVKRHHKNVETP